MERTERIGPFDGCDTRTMRRDRIGTALAVASQFALVAWTLLLADTIQAAFTGRVALAPRLVLLLALIALRAALRDASTALLASVSDEVRAVRRRALVAGLIAGVATDRRSTAGEDGTLLGPGIDALDEFVTRYRPARTTAAVVPLVVLVIVGVLDPLSMAILLFTGPMLLALLALIGSRTRTLADRRLAELGWLRSFHLDMVQGIPTLRVFGRSREGAHMIGETSERFAATTMDVLRTAFQTSLVIEWAATAATALVAVQVGLRIVDRHMGFAAGLAVLLLTPEFFSPFRTLAVEYHAGRSGEAALERLRTTVRVDHETTGRVRAAIAPTRTAPTISLRDVAVRAPDDGRLLLDGASATLAAGETVALVAPSGSGKTTLARVLLALHRLEGGTVEVDDVDLADLDPERWRRSITFVTQRPAILSGTVADAIALSSPDASRDAIGRAARIACADEFIDDLPLGLDTPVGEGGVRLSGGQRQRLAIARAVLRDAPVVVLDEFTAHLDPHTEAKVVERITPFLADRTALLLAHRDATLALADRVLTISDRRLIEVDR